MELTGNGQKCVNTSCGKILWAWSLKYFKFPCLLIVTIESLSNVNNLASLYIVSLTIYVPAYLHIVSYAIVNSGERL